MVGSNPKQCQTIPYAHSALVDAEGNAMPASKHGLACAPHMRACNGAGNDSAQ